MSNADIEINENILSGVITSLKKDNETINEKVNLIYESINKLTDDKIWYSPEKKAMMEDLIPYLEESKEGIKNELSNCVGVLDKALENYRVTNEGLRKNADKLASVEIIEEL